MSVAEGSVVNQRIRRHGCFALINLQGSISILSPNVVMRKKMRAYLESGTGYRIEQLKDFLQSICIEA